MPNIAALIFDVDGTLAETEELHRRAFNETFAAHDLGWVWEEDLYLDLLRTTGGKERIRAYQREYLDGDILSEADIHALHAQKTARYAKLVADGGLVLRPGIEDLLQLARSLNWRLAVATTTTRPNVEALCQAVWACEALEVFDVIAAGDEVEAKKPAPDVYLLALERLGLSPELCVAFEDSEAGVRAAHGAGIRVFVSPSQYTLGQDFELADGMATSFEAFGRLISHRTTARQYRLQQY